MKHRKIEICILSVLLLMAAVYFGMQRHLGREPLSFQAVTDHGSEWIYPWIGDDGSYHVFIPGYVNLSQLKIRTDRAIRLDGRRLMSGTTCESLQTDQTYALEGMGAETSITFYKSDQVPTMFIDTESGTMDAINASKDHEEMGRLRLYTKEGRADYRGNLASIKGHGQSTFESDTEKKPYGLRLRAAGDLLDMGTAKKWVLFANWYDSSSLRNKLAFDYAQAVGLAYSPQSQWVDLYLNGNYMGLYLLSEKNEIGLNRVNISPDSSFLISHDLLHRFIDQGNPYFVTDNGVPLRIHSCTIQEEDMISLVQSAENAMMAEDGRDPETGKHWTELIDLDSWAGKYLVEEIFGGGDAGNCSQYFYYEGNGTDGKIYAGPVWDYDMSMGLSGETPNIFYAHVEKKATWFYELYNKQEFKDRVKELYRERYQPVLQDLIEHWIPEYVETIRQAAALSAIRWWGDPVADAGNIQSYMRERMNFLTDVWINENPYVEVTVVRPDRYDERINYALKYGASVEDIPGLERYDWYESDMETPFDKTKPVYENVMIYGKDPSEGKKE